MNWLGAGLPSFLAALGGAAVGALLHALLLRHGVDLPPLVALVASVGAVLPSKERSGLRGILVASLSCWAAALVDVVVRPERGVVLDLLHFSARLTTLGLGLYLLSAVLGVAVASRARPGVA
ncbi:MAG: hypothetical protein KIT84_00975 [Labilithrix sp.]|nr:hypothetical protein [Labilithrix sp.]MCW5809557.1 hypothetical protein [Labilithrix sp.]